MKRTLVLVVTERNGETIVQGRSEEGKLLIEKTHEGYELKCPRSKEYYLITYEEMLADYKRFKKEASSEKKIKQMKSSGQQSQHSAPPPKKGR